MHNIINEIMNFAVHLINTFGYIGILVAGTLEFLALPVSGEVLVPAIGLMVSKSHLSFVLALIFLTIGSVLGTLVLYAIGYYFSNWANNFTQRKLSKYNDKIDKLNHWIRNHSASVNFFARFLPFLRVYISLFAGIEKVNPISFTFFSTLGIGLWNLFFMLIGYYLGDNLDLFINFVKKTPYITVAILIITLIILILFFLYYKKNKKKKK